MNTDIPTTLSRKALQNHLDEAIDGTLANLNVPEDPKNAYRVARCLIRRAVREMARHIPSNALPLMMVTQLAHRFASVVHDSLTDGTVTFGGKPEVGSEAGPDELN